MTRCVAVLGAAGVGKSTLVDHLATLEGTTPPTAAYDDLRCVGFQYLDEKWVALDCPGGVEFQQLSLDALLVADAAIIVLSPNPEHAVLAAPYIRLAEASGVPHYFFVNKMDESRGRLRDVISAVQGYSAQPVALRQVPIRDGEDIVGAVDLVSERAWKYQEEQPSALIEIPDDMLEREMEARESLLESLADFDDALMEELIEDRQPGNDAVFAICARVLEESRLAPALCGSALHGNGVFRLMKALRHEAPSLEQTRQRLNGASAAVFHSQHRKHVGKTTILRALNGSVAAGSALGGKAIGMLAEPIGEKPKSVGVIEAGDVLTAMKADHLAPGRLYTDSGESDPPEWWTPLPPVWARAVAPKSDREDAKLSESLAKLAADDPSITVSHDAETGAQVLSCQGGQHLKRARTVLAEVFGVETDEADVTPSYRETITRRLYTHYRHRKQSGGAGQFADVKLTVGPNPRGEGFSFEQKIHGGSVPRQFIPAVQHGAEEATHKGPLGFPVIDLSVTLTDGQYHSVDSSDMAFRIAGRSGVTEALSEAGPVLLEPIYEVTFHAPSTFTGALNPLISQRRGQMLGIDRDGAAEGWDVVRAMLPGAALDGLIADLRSVTQGVGRFESEFAHFQEIYGREADQVVEARRNADNRR